MTWLEEHWLQLLLVAAYLAMLVRHGWEGKRHARSLADFLVAGRGLGGWLIALSFYATFVSTNTFIGQAGKSWEVGIIWYVKAVAFAVLCYAAWYIVAPPFVRDARRYGSLTLAEFLGCRYRSTGVRRLAALVVVLGSALYLVAVYRGSSLALEQFLGLPYRWSALIVFGIVTTYTLAGGFRSVVLTDAVQGALMAVGAVAIVVAVLVKGGGPATLLAAAHAQDPDLVSWHGNMPLVGILGLALAGGLKFLVDPRQLSRFDGLRDEPALRLARVVAPLLILVTYLALLPVGVLARGLVPEGAIQQSDELIPYLLGTADLFGPTLSTVFLLVLLSAAMSSLDSVLLVAASSVDHDLVSTGRTAARNDAVAIFRTRLWVVAISLASMLAALDPFGDIVDVTALSGSLFGACFLPALVVGLYWRRGGAAAAGACFLVGTVAVVAGYVARKQGWTEWHEVYLGIGSALVTYVAVSLAAPRGAGDA